MLLLLLKVPIAILFIQTWKRLRYVLSNIISIIYTLFVAACIHVYKLSIINPYCYNPSLFTYWCFILYVTTVRAVPSMYVSAEASGSSLVLLL